jgi:hypothetical protein
MCDNSSSRESTRRGLPRRSEKSINDRDDLPNVVRTGWAKHALVRKSCNHADVVSGCEPGQQSHQWHAMGKGPPKPEKSRAYATD